jgi:hypothetical protein
VRLRKIDIFDRDEKVGVNEVCLLAEDTILAITAIAKSQRSMRHHLQNFLCHTRMAHLQWINLNHQEIAFVTLHDEGQAE